jgi:hypothetical protein
MVEIIRSTTISIGKENTDFRVNVLKSKITGKTTYECFYFLYGREYHQFNHSPHGLMKRFYHFVKMVGSGKSPSLPVRVLYKLQYEHLVMGQPLPNQDYLSIVEHTL